MEPDTLSKSLLAAAQSVADYKCQIRELQNDIKRIEWDTIKTLSEAKLYHCLTVNWSRVRQIR